MRGARLRRPRVGFCSDMTRTVFLGEPEGKMLDAWLTMRRANEEVEAMIRPVSPARRRTITPSACWPKAASGSDGPQARARRGHRHSRAARFEPRNLKPLAAGNVVTVEPGIYIPASSACAWRTSAW